MMEPQYQNPICQHMHEMMQATERELAAMEKRRQTFAKNHGVDKR